MTDKKGFTLVELLVAAAIISILLVFATVQYRNSAAEARWTQARANAEQLANAVQRALKDYPGMKFNPAVELVDIHGMTCPTTRYTPEPFEPYILIHCGFLEKVKWAKQGYFEYFVCKDSTLTTDHCPAAALVCVSPKCSARMPREYKLRRYCVFEDGARDYVSEDRCPVETGE